jgi:hypothetical protein
MQCTTPHTQQPDLCTKWALTIESGISWEFRILFLRNTCSLYEIFLKFLSNSFYNIPQCPLRSQPDEQITQSITHADEQQAPAIATEAEQKARQIGEEATQESAEREAEREAEVAKREDMSQQEGEQILAHLIPQAAPERDSERDSERRENHLAGLLQLIPAHLWMMMMIFRIY